MLYLHYMKEAIDKIRKSLSPYYSKGEIESFIRIIFEYLLNYSPVDIIMHKDSVLSDFIIRKIDKVIEELQAHKPIQYIFGETYFYGHKFKVTPDTLIPRPETEELVDLIVKENPESDLNVLDIGTGSGAIAISLALSLRFPEVTAYDISEKAIEVAKGNAKLLKAKVTFENCDILKAKAAPFTPALNIIVSNPPYICEWEKREMEENVLFYEPGLALFVPDSDPLLFYRAITEYAKDALIGGGKLYFEINNRYAQDTAKMIKGMDFEAVTTYRDVHNLPRFISAIKSIDNA